MVTGEFENFDHDVVNQDFSQRSLLIFGCRIIVVMKIVFIKMETITIAIAMHTTNTSNTIAYNSRINIK